MTGPWSRHLAAHAHHHHHRCQGPRHRTAATHHRAGVAGAYTATTYTYNRKNQLTKVTDAGGNEWTIGYDLKGREITRKDPDAGTTTTTYNAYDELETTTNGAGEVLYRAYDALGRQTQLRDDFATGNLRAEWKYDKFYTGQPLKGQLTEAIRYDDNNPKNTRAAYKWQVRTLNDRYQVLGSHYVIPTEEGTGLAGTWISSNSYSPYTGEPTGGTYPEVPGIGAEQVTTEFHASNGLPNKLKKTGLVSVDTYVANQMYTAYGEPTFTKRQITNGRYVDNNVLYERSTRRVKQTTVQPQSAAGTVASTTYERDEAGNILGILDAPAVGATDSQCFRYDALRRLTAAWTPKNRHLLRRRPDHGEPRRARPVLDRLDLRRHRQPSCRNQSRHCREHDHQIRTAHSRSHYDPPARGGQHQHDGARVAPPPRHTPTTMPATPAPVRARPSPGTPKAT